MLFTQSAAAQFQHLDEFRLYLYIPLLLSAQHSQLGDKRHCWMVAAFRIILLRAMAWTMYESFDPFKPLVTLHLGRAIKHLH